jgi:hypothetical protein
MICEWCGKSFPTRKGRFCGGCVPARKKRLAEAVEDARAVIGCLLNLLDENDAVFDLCKSNVVLWNVIEKARDWENKHLATGAIRP